MIGKIILIPRYSLMDALNIMERQNKIGEDTNDRVIVATGKDGPNKDSHDFQFVVAALNEDVFKEIIMDFKNNLTEVYIQDKQITSK